MSLRSVNAVAARRCRIVIFPESSPAGRRQTSLPADNYRWDEGCRGSSWAISPPILVGRGIWLRALLGANHRLSQNPYQVRVVSMRGYSYYGERPDAAAWSSPLPHRVHQRIVGENFGTLVCRSHPA